MTLAPNDEQIIRQFSNYLSVRIENGDCSVVPLLAELVARCDANGGCHGLDGRDWLLSLQLRKGMSCGAELVPRSAKPLPMPDDVIQQ